jgi:hypothetical protein
MLIPQAMWFAVVSSSVALVVSADAMSLAMLVIIAVVSVNSSLVVALHNAQGAALGTPAVLLVLALEVAEVPLGAQAVLVVKQRLLLAVSAVEESFPVFAVLFVAVPVMLRLVRVRVGSVVTADNWR